MAYEIDPDTMKQLEGLNAEWESNNNPDATNPSSSASGRYQITDGTFADILKNHPELTGSDKNDSRVFDAFTNDNASVLQRNLGRQPTPVDLHAAHFLGATGATRFLTADPNTPVTAVVSRPALDANRAVFFDKQGRPYTVGQVYAAASQKFGGSPNMPPAQGGTMAERNPGSYTVASANAGTASDANPNPNAPPASPPSVPSAPSAAPGGFASADSVYGPQQTAIQNYISSQPAMWQKLQDMQTQYQQQSQPTFLDRLGDVMNSYSQQSNAARANQLASTGGILLHANPDATSFNNALQAGHQSDLQERQQRLNTAKTAYDLGTQNLLAQNQQQGANLGLTGQLAQEKGQYGFQVQNAINTNSLNQLTKQLEIAKFSQDQVKQIGDYIEKAIPNPETRAKVMSEFTASGSPSGSLSSNMAIVNGLIQKHQESGDQISAKEPARMYSVTTFDPDTGGQKVETVNAATPQGQARLNEVSRTMPNARIADLGATTVNVGMPNSSSKSESESGGGSLADSHLAAIQTRLQAEAASDLLDFLATHGGTGAITDSDDGKVLANKLKQVTGIDTVGVSARELYGKLMTQIQTGQAGPMMKAMGPRPSQAEFQRIMQGQLSSTASVKAAKTYLDHIRQTMSWQQRMIEEQSNANLQAKRENNTYFDPDNWRIQWQSKPGNQPPSWQTTEARIDGLSRAEREEQGLGNPPPQPEPGPVRGQPGLGTPLPEPTPVPNQTINGKNYQLLNGQWYLTPGGQ